MKGDVVRIVMVLGFDVNIIDILFKFESVYGIIYSKVIVLLKFYFVR